MSMNYLKGFLITFVLTMLSCGGGGGGGSTTSSRFNGIWRGDLTGTDCTGMPVSKSLVHVVDSDSEEIGSEMSLTDIDGVVYEGIIDGTASVSGARYGFACSSTDKPGSVIDYNILNRPENIARVIETITDEFCQYDLKGDATRDIL